MPIINKIEILVFWITRKVIRFFLKLEKSKIKKGSNVKGLKSNS